MSRIRYIKPQFFDNYELSQLDPYARLLFISLWCQADREGRLKDEPERIRARALPYNKVNINKLLDLLASGEDSWIVRYEAGGTKYIQVRNWKKHQHPHVKEPASTIPAPCSHHAKPEQTQGENCSSPLGNGEWGMGNGEWGTEAGGERPLDDLRDEFWNAYPEARRSKPGLIDHWYAANVGQCMNPGKLHAEIMAGLERAKRSASWAKEGGKYVCSALAFLEGERWREAWLGAVPEETQIERCMRLIREQEAEEARQGARA